MLRDAKWNGPRRRLVELGAERNESRFVRVDCSGLRLRVAKKRVDVRDGHAGFVEVIAREIRRAISDRISSSKSDAVAFPHA